MINENALKILERDFLQRDKKGNVCEGIEDFFRRIAHSIAIIDKAYGEDNIVKIEQQFFDMMYELDFLPNSPTLRNAGKEDGQLSACFVLPIEDSIDSIYGTLAEAAIVQKSGGGTGFSFSKLRPKNDPIGDNKGTASGPVSFIEVFNSSTNAIKQGGIRRGANIAVLDISHPDIEEFILCKNDNYSLTNFNISVGITDDYMKALEDDMPFSLINPRDGKEVKRVSSRELFEKIVVSAHEYGEPGVLFWDAINKGNIFAHKETVTATNPCGEQPLLDYESCNLGSINLSNMCIYDGEKYSIDSDKLIRTVKVAIHFLDNVIDANVYPLKKIEEKTKQTRKIGLGVMGWADALIKLKVAYNSQEARDLAIYIMNLIQNEGSQMSEELARQRGPFPLAKETNLFRRNATITTIAPTGTLSLIAGCSSGIEPIFALAYTKLLDDGLTMKILSPELLNALKLFGLNTPELIQEIKERGTLEGVKGIPDELKRILITAQEITYDDHVKMQAAFQMHTDNAVSKTINLPSSASIQEVRNAFILAHELGCKGITIFRDGCKRNQVLKPGIDNSIDAFGKRKPKPRSPKLPGHTHKIPTGCGTLYVTVNRTSDGIAEVFTNTGKGGCHSQSEAIARLISVGLRSGVSLDAIISQLDEVKCVTAIKATNGKIRSCPHAIATAMVDNDAIYLASTQPLCSCGSEIVYENGCFMCKNCGKSNCQ